MITRRSIASVAVGLMSGMMLVPTVASASPSEVTFTTFQAFASGCAGDSGYIYPVDQATALLVAPRWCNGTSLPGSSASAQQSADTSGALAFYDSATGTPVRAQAAESFTAAQADYVLPADATSIDVEIDYTVGDISTSALGGDFSGVLGGAGAGGGHCSGGGQSQSTASAEIRPWTLAGRRTLTGTIACPPGERILAGSAINAVVSLTGVTRSSLGQQTYASGSATFHRLVLTVN